MKDNSGLGRRDLTFTLARSKHGQVLYYFSLFHYFVFIFDIFVLGTWTVLPDRHKNWWGMLKPRESLRSEMSGVELPAPSL